MVLVEYVLLLLGLTLLVFVLSDMVFVGVVLLIEFDEFMELVESVTVVVGVVALVEYVVVVCWACARPRLHRHTASRENCFFMSFFVE
ncbi:hypothetical protein GCM10028805_03110 [Spirosoma harenae]